MWVKIAAMLRTLMDDLAVGGLVLQGQGQDVR